MKCDEHDFDWGNIVQIEAVGANADGVGFHAYIKCRKCETVATYWLQTHPIFMGLGALVDPQNGVAPPRYRQVKEASQ